MKHSFPMLALLIGSSTAWAEPPAFRLNDTMQAMLLVTTGLPQAPYDDTEHFHNGFGVRTKTNYVIYRPNFMDPCLLELTLSRKVEELDSWTKQWKTTSSTSTRRYDFRKMTGLKTDYRPDPTEALLQYFGAGAGQSTYKPRMVTLVEYQGTEAFCMLSSVGKEPLCSTAVGSPNVSFQYPAAQPAKLQAAFLAIKQVCADP